MRVESYPLKSGFFIALVCNFPLCYNAEMTEREVSFAQVAAAEMPKDIAISREDWKVGMAVVKTLFELGQPKKPIVNKSAYGPEFPNRYVVKGENEEATIDFLPHWSQMGIEQGEKREIFSLDSSRLSVDKVVDRVRDKIQEVTQKKQ